MKKHQLVYLPSERYVKVLGVLARAATRAKNDVGRCIVRLGKLAHGNIVSKRAPTVRNKPADYKRDRTPKNTGFQSGFLRKTEGKWQPRSPKKRSPAKKKMPPGAVVSPSAIKLDAGQASTAGSSINNEFCHSLTVFFKCSQSIPVNSCLLC
jgi:hypothetical protein